MNGPDALVAHAPAQGSSWGNRRAFATPLAGLRGKLAATAAAGFVLTGLMTVLVVRTTGEAREVVEQAQASHDRMQVFARLQSTANRLQRLTFQNVRILDSDSAADLEMARADFAAALTKLHALPQPTAQERALVQTVARQGQAVSDLFSHGGEDIVDAVNAAWSTAGSHAALQEVQVRSEPYRIFSETVSREVGREDQQLTNVTSLAVAQQQSVRQAALVGLALAFGLSVAVFALLLSRLEESRAGLERAVAERTAELERANAALSEEYARRRSFLADASHELRMPLTIIRGETQVALRAGLQARHDFTEVFERILEQTRVLTRVFDDLFLIARAEAGGLRLNLSAVDVGDLVRRVAQDFSTIACESGATVHVEASGGLAARVDPDRVRQALAALIDNALRHAGAGVRVRVEARATGDCIMITVTDNGPGIESGMAAELFARFRRGHTRSEGSGLGLSVVRALAEAHGGTASLSNAEQGGAQATLRLPHNKQVSIGGWSDVVTAGGG